MHDIKAIRENPEAFDAGLARRGLAPQSAELIKLDAVKREEITELQNLQAKRNEVAKAIPEAKKRDEDISALLAEGNAIKEKIAQLEAAQNEGGALEEVLSRIPNILAADVPDGADETSNKELRVVGKKPEFSFAPKDHVAIGEGLGMMDFEAAAKLSGARFVVLRHQLARLERAIATFMLDMHLGKGYVEHQVPYLVKDTALYGTGQLPKFAEDLFRTTGEHYLIPTAEVSLTNLVSNEILDETKLPMRMTAWTPCFRSEAGSAGKDTRGMIRQHQFSKVELVSVTTPEQSVAEHERMLGCAEDILKRLGLHYRVMLLCAGDTGFSARKTYDIEVWLPGQEAFREISSCSNCGDFQARRMKARYKKSGVKETQFVHTLNGSGLAVGRTLVAILENYQQADGSVMVPNALIPYMGGKALLTREG